MDSDFWATRLAAAKRQFHRQHHAASHLDRLNWSELYSEDDVRPDLTCPYCYDDFDLGSLCTHLENEHSSDFRPTVCPICAGKVCSDLLSHVTLQHGQILKVLRRRRLRNLLGRDADLHILPEGNGLRSNSNRTINDPFLSSLVLNLPPDQNSTSDVSLDNAIQAKPWKPSYDPCLSGEERERMRKQASGRARFVQDLLFCTLLQD